MARLELPPTDATVSHLVVPDQNDHLRQLSGVLDELQRSLIELSRPLNTPSDGTSRANALESAHRHLNMLKTLARLLESDAAENRSQVERAEREAWNQKVRRADASTKLKAREQLLEQIQRSAAWKIVKPIWKLFNRSRKRTPDTGDIIDLAFALDLPKQWTTSRDLLLIKGWCFSRSGRQIAGIRAKIGNKAKLACYGLDRPDIAKRFREYPEAQHCGFTIELKVLSGISTIQLEAIEQGSDWQPFLREKLERETNADLSDESELSTDSDAPQEQILKLPSLSASKAFELLRNGFQQHAARGRSQAPVISVITPTHNTKPEWIAEAGLSLLNQTFNDWEWCIVDDHSDDRKTKKLLELLANVNGRIRISSSPDKGISAANNHALERARGENVCFLDHDDLLHPQALESIHRKLGEGYDVVYSDEDKLEDESGELVEPFFKPDWSPEYFRGAMYVGHLLCVRRDLAIETRFDSAFDGVQDFEFMLRLSESNPRIGHIPQILYHWRKTAGSVAEKTDAKPHLGLLQERAVNAHLQRLKFPARAEQAQLPHRLKIVAAKRDNYPRVSIIIPTRDALDVFGRCLKSVFEKTSYPDFEVIVMDNETSDPIALDLMKSYSVRRIEFPGNFNFSRANNNGAAAATGKLLVFLNNDTEDVNPDWLHSLAYY